MRKKLAQDVIEELDGRRRKRKPRGMKLDMRKQAHRTALHALVADVTPFPWAGLGRLLEVEDPYELEGGGVWREGKRWVEMERLLAEVGKWISKADLLFHEEYDCQ